MGLHDESYISSEAHEDPKDSYSPAPSTSEEVFGSEANNDIKYRTLSWPMVSVLMIAEIVSNGMLSLPSSLAVVGIVPGVIIIVFLGIFATYTSWLLVQFKLRHPHVHTMGDAGYILFGPIGREILSFGTVCFAIFACGGQLLAGQIALASLSDGKLCLMLYTGIFAIPTLLCSLPRTFHGLGWFSVASVLSILVAGIVGMAAAGLHPIEPREVDVSLSSDFVTAFTSITNPVFSFAGHFMFFVLISEMKQPRDAMKAAYVLQGFATSYYTIFAAVTYAFLGSKVASPSFSSLDPYWQKVAYGIALPNFLLAGSLYAHTASKLIFVRIFRNTHHVGNHTTLGWGVWITLVVICNAAAFVLAVGVPIFNYLIGIAAAMFAAWFTYGVAGMFWLHDSYHDGHGTSAWSRRPYQAALAFVTVIIGAFICVAGLYVSIVGIKNGYASGLIPKAFAC